MTSETELAYAAASERQHLWRLDILLGLSESPSFPTSSVKFNDDSPSALFAP